MPGGGKNPARVVWKLRGFQTGRSFEKELALAVSVQLSNNSAH